MDLVNDFMAISADAGDIALMYAYLPASLPRYVHPQALPNLGEIDGRVPPTKAGWVGSLACAGPYIPSTRALFPVILGLASLLTTQATAG